VDARGSAGPVRPRRWRPWLGQPRAADLLCFAGIALGIGYGFATIPLTPVLIASHPVLLEMLTGSTAAVVAAGAFSDIDSRLQLGLVIVAALPGLMMFDPLYWWAGRRWGQRAVEWLGHRNGRAAALVQRAGQRGSRFALPVVLLAAFLPGIPAPLIYAAAGWAGLGLVPFLVCDAIGSLAWAAVLAGLGEQLGPSGVTAASIISRYALLATIALLAIAVAPHAWHVRRTWRHRARRRALATAPGADGGLTPGELARPEP
jgi:membrane protein DedA with SNARE-associated domain